MSRVGGHAPLARPNYSRPFTIVIPTLQRSTLLIELVRRLGESPLVHEIVVINNAAVAWPSPHPRCRVLNLPANIYVNPAWNLGVEEATTRYIGLCNDDVLFDPRILALIARRLDRGAGIVGPASSCVRDVAGRRPVLCRRPVFVPAYERPYAFGTMMFLERINYTPIPDDLLVWRGDDYLFRRQVSRNFMMYGIDVATHMSTTSSDPAFDAIKKADMTAFHNHYSDDPYRLRYWKEFRVTKSVRTVWYRARKAATRRREVENG